MTRAVIAPSVYLGEVHHALVCSCDRLPIVPNIKGVGKGNNEALKAVFGAHSLAHRCAVDRSDTKGDTSL